MDLLYSAIRGKGAFKNGRPIRCSGQTGTTNFLCQYQINIFFIDLALSQIAGEYGSNREPDILTAKCQNLRVIVEKVHR
jgi:fructose-1,6-bisphosphatase/inositol monophosphatase family enzyme